MWDSPDKNLTHPHVQLELMAGLKRAA